MKAKKEVYFGKHAQEKIVEFVNAKTEAEKTLIYNNFLQKPLAKLCENIINYERFNFKEIDSYGNLHNELMSHLYSILHKYNPKRNITKAIKIHNPKATDSYFKKIMKNMKKLSKLWNI